MSREPSSSMMHGWRAFAEPTPEPTPPKPRRVRVVVEPAKPKPVRRSVQRRDQVVNKLLSTTEALTAEERGLLRELRKVNPAAAGLALAKIKDAQRAIQEGRR